MKIRNKLFIAFAIVLILFSSGGAYIAFSVAKISQLNESIQTEQVIAQAASDFQRGALLKQSGTYAYLSGNTEVGQAQIDEGQAILVQSEATLKALQASALTNETQDKINLMLTGYIHSFEDSISTYSNFTITLYERNNRVQNDEVNSYAQYVSSDMTNLNTFISNLDNQIKADYDSANAVIREYSDQTATITVILVVATVALAGAIAVVVARRITKPISQLSNVADRVSQGDFSQAINVKTGDEIESLAESFERMVNAFKMTVAMSQENAEENTQQ
jgi:Signal transduction histidine kinase involved in nitrogen fixation and metabolism regulation